MQSKFIHCIWLLSILLFAVTEEGTKIPTLQVRKLGVREAEELAQDHMTLQWESQGAITCLTPKHIFPVLLPAPCPPNPLGSPEVHS